MTWLGSVKSLFPVETVHASGSLCGIDEQKAGGVGKKMQMGPSENAMQKNANRALENAMQRNAKKMQEKSKSRFCVDFYCKFVQYSK